MRIIAKSKLKAYWELPGNEHMQAYLNEWYHFCSKQIWKTPQDVMETLRNESIIANNSVVFNIKGNLTLPQLVQLNKELHIPYKSLIEERHYL